MISLEVDGLLPVLGRLDGMLYELRELRGRDLSAELAAWQTEDVHRERPFVRRQRGRPVVVWTRFRPHSWVRMRHHRAAQRRLIRRGRYIGFGSIRPILRQSMIDRLEQRMADLLQEIHW
jgi:hypothetical protein